MDYVARHHGELSIETQFKEYLLDPLTEGAHAVNGPVIIILDGLDECGQSKSILKLFSSGIFSKLPHNFRFLITSRWGSEIADSFLAFPDSVHQVFLNISDDYSSPVIELFDHMDSIFEQSNRSYNRNEYKLFSDCVPPRIYTHKSPVSQSSLGDYYVSAP